MQETTQEEREALFREDLEWILPKLPKEEDLKKPAIGKASAPAPRDGRGRPTLMTKECVLKLKHAFLTGLTIDESCYVVGISHQTFYNFCQKYPDFLDQVKQWRRYQVVLAKGIIRRDLDAKDSDAAKFVLKTQAKDEYSERLEISPTNFSQELQERTTKYEDPSLPPQSDAVAPADKRAKGADAADVRRVAKRS